MSTMAIGKFAVIVGFKAATLGRTLASGGVIVRSVFTSYAQVHCFVNLKTLASMIAGGVTEYAAAIAAE